jgi:HPt (histidine-containing phosphotransfer) domain-containing protein
MAPLDSSTAGTPLSSPHLAADEAVFVLQDALDYIGSPDSLRVLARRFLEQLPGDESALESLLAGQPRHHVELRRHAHSLKTSSAYLGGRRLRSAAMALEAAAMAGDSGGEERWSASVRTERRALASALKAWL